MVSSNSGVYQIRINVCKTCSIIIGKLGNFTFPRGQYVYTGRAKTNLEQRIERHKKRDKKCFWHIDYLLMDVNVLLEDIAIISDNYGEECSENKKMHKKCVHSFYNIFLENFRKFTYLIKD